MATVPAPDPRFEQWSIPGLRLEVLEGPDQGATMVPQTERLVLGTHRSADFILSDPTVSRFHCELEISEGRVRVRDLGSRNGTRIGGLWLNDAELSTGQVLALGRTRVQVGLADERVGIAVSGRRGFGRLVGATPVMRAVYALLESAAGNDVTVLLEGETGTGKELAAEAIHCGGARSDGPFVVVDCGSLPPQLVESELFGHERGAFTGADRQRVGAFELASGGTLFLDEVGELPLELQPKLLRVLERQELRRLGSNELVRVDVRVIAATNRDLRREVNQRRFRPDLYFRLAVLRLRMPPLRERTADLPLLVEALLAEESAAEAARAALVQPSTVAELATQPWPGNVRELRNYIRRCLVLERPAPMDGDLPAAAAEGLLPLRQARQHCIDAFERRYLATLLERHGGNVSAAARAAGVDRVHLHRLLARHRDPDGNR